MPVLESWGLVVVENVGVPTLVPGLREKPPDEKPGGLAKWLDPPSLGTGGKDITSFEPTLRCQIYSRYVVILVMLYFFMYFVNVQYKLAVSPLFR